MFTINDDLSIYATRGDTVFFTVTAEENGVPYTFQAGDVLRMKIFGKKDAENVVLEKCFPVTAATDKFTILLTEEDTKIGEVISKPKDYWYEIELNPFTNPQTIIGYDEDGAKVFKLFPEGKDSEEPEVDPEDIPVVDDELDMASNRPVENRAIARAIVNLEGSLKATEKKVTQKANNISATATKIEKEVAVERKRVDALLSSATSNDAELIDVRVGADGVTYGSAGTAVRKQFEALNRHGKKYRGMIVPLGYSSLTQCKENGFYWIHTYNDLPYVDDKPVDMVNGGVMYVDVLPIEYPDADINSYYQTIIDNSGNQWMRTITEALDGTDTVNEWVLLGENYLKHGIIETLASSLNNAEQRLLEVITNGSTTIREWEIGEVNVSDGIECDNNARVRTSHVFLTKGSVLSFTADLENFAGMYVIQYDTELNFVKSSGGYVTTYTASNDCYIRIVTKYTDNREINDASVFDGFVRISYSQPSSDRDYFITGDFATYFDAPEMVDMTTTLGGTTAESIYGRYDTLVQNNPMYIKRNLLGYATSTDGEDDTSLPIYEYVISADVSDRAINSVPTILIQSGIHGNEKSSVYGTLMFVEGLFNIDNDVIINIRSNFNFKILPILNPYGYNSNVRTNARGVDINRNFSYLWTENDSEIKGTAPYSEKESQILRDWLKANSTAFMYIDYHNMGDYNPFISYINTPNEIIQNVYSNFIRRTTAKWRRKYHPERVGSVYGWINNDRIPCTHNEAVYVGGIPLSCTLEVAWDEGGRMYTKRVMETSYEQLVNFVASMVDYFKKH